MWHSKIVRNGEVVKHTGLLKVTEGHSHVTDGDRLAEPAVYSMSADFKRKRGRP